MTRELPIPHRLQEPKGPHIPKQPSDCQQIFEVLKSCVANDPSHYNTALDQLDTFDFTGSATTKQTYQWKLSAVIAEQSEVVDPAVVDQARTTMRTVLDDWFDDRTSSHPGVLHYQEQLGFVLPTKDDFAEFIRNHPPIGEDQGQLNDIFTSWRDAYCDMRLRQADAEVFPAGRELARALRVAGVDRIDFAEQWQTKDGIAEAIGAAKSSTDEQARQLDTFRRQDMEQSVLCRQCFLYSSLEELAADLRQFYMPFGSEMDEEVLQRVILDPLKRHSIPALAVRQYEQFRQTNGYEYECPWLEEIKCWSVIKAGTHEDDSYIYQVELSSQADTDRFAVYCGKSSTGGDVAHISLKPMLIPYEELRLMTHINDPLTQDEFDQMRQQAERNGIEPTEFTYDTEVTRKSITQWSFPEETHTELMEIFRTYGVEVDYITSERGSELQRNFGFALVREAREALHSEADDGEGNNDTITTYRIKMPEKYSLEITNPSEDTVTKIGVLSRLISRRSL
jgi:hypothetical protein